METRCSAGPRWALSWRPLQLRLDISDATHIRQTMLLPRGHAVVSASLLHRTQYRLLIKQTPEASSAGLCARPIRILGWPGIACGDHLKTKVWRAGVETRECCPACTICRAHGLHSTKPTLRPHASARLWSCSEHRPSAGMEGYDTHGDGVPNRLGLPLWLLTWRRYRQGQTRSHTRFRKGAAPGSPNPFVSDLRIRASPD